MTIVNAPLDGDAAKALEKTSTRVAKTGAAYLLNSGGSHAAMA